MKYPAGPVKPRRLSAPKTAPKKKVRLDLKRRPEPKTEEDLEIRQNGHFWKWVILVALFHVVAISLFYFIYEFSSPVKPPQEFISLLPEGDVVKGTAGAQEASKVGPSTPAPTVHHVSATAPEHTAQPPKPKPLAKKPPTPTPKPIPPKAELKTEAPSLEPPKPVTPPPPITPPKPVEPKVPKVKVDLSKVEDAPTSADNPKPKTHVKKPAPKTDDTTDQDQAESKPDSTGLSKEQIAAKLGEKLDETGETTATHTGTSGSTNGHDNPFKDFYNLIKIQIDQQWQIPNGATEITTNPVVHIHVENDGRVPPESVYLVQSSGNSTYDDSAIAAAKSLGYLHEPLPEHCPPDISIIFKPDR